MFDHQQEKELGYLISQVEIAKQRYRASLDFAPPITPSHLALALPPNSHPHHPHPPSSARHQALKTELRGVLAPVRAGNGWAGQIELQQLISLNVPYLLLLEGQRRSSRRPLGCDLWQMQLRTALLQFLDSLKRSLSRVEFRNVEVLVALLVYFFTREVEEEEEVTTTNYVQHLNTFASRFLTPLTESRPYNRVFSLRGDRPGRLLVLVHQWMALEGLTDYVVELAKDSSRDGHQANESNPAND